VQSTPPSDAEIAAMIRVVVTERGSGKTCCPSDVARRLVSEDAAWRALMPRVRTVARSLAADGEVVISQRGTLLDPAKIPTGPIRIGLA